MKKWTKKAGNGSSHISGEAITSNSMTLCDQRQVKRATFGIMKAPVDPVRVSARGREQLIKLKRQTGIEHWNVLCRWALCCSLREPSVPPRESLKTEGGVEIAWKVF